MRKHSLEPDAGGGPLAGGTSWSSDDDDATGASLFSGILKTSTFGIKCEQIEPN